MSIFEEEYRRVLAGGLAKWTLRGTAGIFSLAVTLFLLGCPITAAAILALAAILMLLLAAYVFGWVTSYRKTRQKVLELERRFNLAEAEKLAERTIMARDIYEIELRNKTTPNTALEPTRGVP